jgi:hypothetical protein
VSPTQSAPRSIVSRPFHATPAFLLRTVLLCTLAVLLGACNSVAPSASFSRDVNELLQRGDSYARALGAAPTYRLGDEDVIALGYLERSRLGVGSPFRLIAYVRRDERLTPETREKLAYALLGQTLHEQGYQVDPGVLDILQLMGAPRRADIGERHLRLIERTIAEAPTPTGGERGVRFAYLLAGTERTVDTAPEPVVSYVAAMVADRRRARDDAVQLLRAASRLQIDPLDLLEQWRRELRFVVEAPALLSVSSQDEAAEAARGMQLATILRVMAQQSSAPSTQLPAAYRHDFWARSWLGGPAAARLMELTAEHDYPAQAPVAVAVLINRDSFLTRPGLTPWQLEQRRRFSEAAINEESLVAGAAHLASFEARQGTRLALTLLQSAVFLRGWNQEEPWFPGDPAPTSRELENRFGLAAVSFENDVPEAWRPYYRRMLARSLSDLQRALPTASVRGLRVRFVARPLEGGALALHDPRTRTLIVPTSSSAGTIAHEIAHDLDWQLARSRYGRRGGYASDLAVGRQKGDRLAASLASLSASFARDPGDGTSTEHDRRPAEVFARGIDWLVAAYLAGEGRTGGYLTSYQDVALAGYGTTRGPQVDGAAVPSLLGILDQIAPPTPELRAWATATYGPTRSLTAKELARALASAQREGRPHARFAALEQAHERALAGMSAVSCRMVPSPDARRIFAVRQHAVRAAVESAVRGIVIDGVRRVAQELDEPPPQREVDDFLVWRLDGGPEPADSAVHVLLPVADELILRGASLLQRDAVVTNGFDLNPERSLCGGNPFAYERLKRREALFGVPRRPHEGQIRP